jgi:hypothetical protein
LDTIIFLLIFATLLAWWCRLPRLGLLLFFASLAAVLLLFNHHVTKELPLNF